MADGPSPQEIAEARRANLLQKHADGKRLTREEREEISDLIDEGESEGKKAAKQRVTGGTIAARLGLPERTVYRILQTERLTASASTEDECLRAVVTYYKTASERVDSAKEADIARRMKAEADEAELRAMRAASQVTLISDAKAVHADFAAAIARIVRTLPGISDAAKTRLGQEIAKVKFGKLEPAEV